MGAFKSVVCLGSSVVGLVHLLKGRKLGYDILLLSDVVCLVYRVNLVFDYRVCALC